LLSFLLGIVVAYQGADSCGNDGANIFVADLVGLSMLREFAPLITAIIIPRRSGSAYAAQIGTMAVTEEIDAMRTIGIAPLDLLVRRKSCAGDRTAAADRVRRRARGIRRHDHGARAVGRRLGEFLDRFVKAVSITAYLIGICKAPVFAVIIAVVGCFQGFRTQGRRRQRRPPDRRRSVVQSIFLVIVADALFSIAFSALDL